MLGSSWDHLFFSVSPCFGPRPDEILVLWILVGVVYGPLLLSISCLFHYYILEIADSDPNLKLVGPPNSLCVCVCVWFSNLLQDPEVESSAVSRGHPQDPVATGIPNGVLLLCH